MGHSNVTLYVYLQNNSTPEKNSEPNLQDVPETENINQYRQDVGAPVASPSKELPQPGSDCEVI